MRKLNLDFARACAILAVVFGHTMMLFWDFDPATSAWAVYNFLWIFIRGFLMLFFMISGFLFLSKKELNFKRHMQRILHMLVLFYVWSLICNTIDTRFLHYWPNEGSLFSRVLSGYYHLWFLPTMSMCYCALYLLHGMTHNDQNNIWRGAMLLFTIVIVLTTLNSIPEKPLWFQSFLSPYDLRYFRYFIIMPVGWQLAERRLSNKVITFLGILSLTMCLLFAYLNRCYAIKIGKAVDTYYGDLTVTAGLMGTFIFSLMLRVEKLPLFLTALVEKISSHSFGIYLIHPLLIDVIRSQHWDFSQYSAAWLFPLCFISAFLASMVLSKILMKMPALDKIVK